MKDSFFGTLIFLLATISLPAHAGPELTYHGRLLNSAGLPVAANVQFRLQILSPGNEKCLLWEEILSADLSQSNGGFSLALNSSSGIRTDGGSLSFPEVFSNRKTLNFPSGKCSQGTHYSPSATDGRLLKVSFNDGTFSGWEDAPSQSINYVPMSLDSQQVAGYPAASLLRFAESDGTLVNTSPLSNAQYTELLALISGTSSKYSKLSATNGTVLSSISGNVSSPQLGSIWFDSSSGALKFYNGSVQTLGTSGGSVTSVSAGSGLTGGPITSSGALSLANTTVSAGTYGTATQVASFVVDAQGRLTSASNITISGVSPGGSAGGDLSGTYPNPTIASGAITTAKLFSNPGVRRLVATDSSTGANLAPLSCGAGELLKWNTTSGWQCGTDSGGNISSIALSLPSIFTVSGSPLTADGTLSATLANQAANLVLASPNGSTGVPSFRALTSADIPGLAWTHITSGKPTTIAGYGITDALRNTGNTPSISAELIANRPTASAATEGRLFIATDENKIYRDNGTSWDVIASANGTGGTLTGITTATGLSGGGTAGALTLSLANTTVSAGTYGTATSVPSFTVDAQGRLTSASEVTITGVAPGGSASGDLSGNYPNPAVAKIQGTAVSSTAPTGSGQVLRYNGTTQYAPAYLTVADLHSSVGPGYAQAFPTTSCTSGQTLTWSSLTDTLVCSNIAISDSAITYASKTQNTFLAAPSTTNGAPTFRTIASADLPSISSGLSGTLPVTNGGTGTTTAFTPGSVLFAGASGVYSENNSKIFWDNSNNRLGIGSTSPRSTADISGTLLTKPATSNSTSTIDLSTGNFQYTASNCGSFQFHNAKDGGSYMFVVQGSTSATCSFTAYSDGGSTALTVHMPPDHGATTASKHTIYTLAVLGTHLYVSWTPGY